MEEQLVSIDTAKLIWEKGFKSNKKSTVIIHWMNSRDVFTKIPYEPDCFLNGEIYNGRAMDLYDLSTLDIEYWRERFVKNLEQDYNEKNCFMCVTSVPEEGIVVRKESLFQYEAYKLKSFAFLEKETKQLDKGEADMESEN